MRTEYFSSCAAVFEGGGVRGAAFAGVYAACLDVGIRFNRVAGSSAGSVAAAFVAAGGTPDAIKTKLMQLDMAKLQGPPALPVPFKGASRWASVLSAVPVDMAKRIAYFLKYSGSYNSAPIRDWVELSLREMLAAGGRPVDQAVRFRDLPLPLYVVAADVLQRGPKVWSLEKTPEESVAFAVQASCAIPFYFQAVCSAQSAFVDGGSISNVPSFVFPPRRGHPGRFAEKTLAFRLKADPPGANDGFEDAIAYAYGIADTIVDSATKIQQSLQSGIYAIEVGTADIRGTDFAKMTAQKKALLFDNGKKAVENFVLSEREVVGRHQMASLYEGFDERLLAYVFAISRAKNTVWLSDSSTYWLYFIYPIIAAAIGRGVSIKVMVQDPPPKDQPVEARRRASLASLGCDVVPVPALAFAGLVIDYPGMDAIAVISSENGAVGSDFTYTQEQVRLYDSQDDFPVIRNLGNALAAQVSAGATASAAPPPLRIVSLDPPVLFDALKRVPQYANASFEIRDVPLDKGLRVSQTHIKEYKLLQIDELVRQLKANRFGLFAPCQFQLSDGAHSIITPPVLELTPNGPVLIEGHTRAFYMAQTGMPHFSAVVVDKVTDPLPVAPRPFSDMRVADNTMTATSILPGYEKALFRQIEAALHP
ncbi:putative esterase of the alpha-beta hydrolase superfamily [Bradyrhizobium sp. YR681]|uniref:patatin-like phospholipase family protein n=1 Tax=Bradyrhizobium sp. YR681 TaxID=1144344 RepID=UPI00026FA8FB|nr:patatin-like phospholipase family protein [Bradyrhizobium sp. YR681]EJN09035.1 putative esterase of the alpha-beta hydrolase superfamily [Bradyrhizobium sp. YR681]